MANELGRKADFLAYRRSVIAGFVGVPVALSGLAFALGASTAGIFLLGVDCVVLLFLGFVKGRELQVARSAVSADLLEFEVQALESMTPYALGVDAESPEALKATEGTDGRRKYLRRDADAALEKALGEALRDESNGFIVLYGSSKAGKSRTLFQGARKACGAIPVVVPSDSTAVEAMRNEDAWPEVDGDTVILWLDDIEEYVEVGAGMTPAVLRDFEQHERRVLILGTAGGRGLRRQTQGDEKRLAEPVADLLRHARVIDLLPKLSDREKVGAREFAPAAASTIERDGVGEFMITGPELVRKLTSGKHRDEQACPEGQAIVWAAIEWRRVGIRDPISRAALEELYRCFLPEHVDSSRELFEAGLSWARKPLYETIALLRGGPDAFQAYDYIIAAAPSTSDIQDDVWSSILGHVTEEQALAMGVTAYLLREREGSETLTPRARAAWSKAAGSDSDAVAVQALYNLGVLTRDLQELSEAQAAFEGAIERGPIGEPVDLMALENLATLLTLHRGEHDRAEDLFERALVIDPAHANTLGNYAIFKRKVRRDLDRAAELFELAIEASDEDGWIFGGYASLISETQADPDRVEELYERSVAASPTDASVLGNYANFLTKGREDQERAESFYERAVEADPEHANNLGNYAIFLHRVREDQERAESFYERAVEADPEHANVLGNYAAMLSESGEDQERASALYERALASNPEHVTHLLNYAMFLSETDEKGIDRAEELYEKAVQIGRDRADVLGAYAVFQTSIRADHDRAEDLFERALEVDPQQESNLANYAIFLKKVRDDPGRAEEFYERALDMNHPHPTTIRSYVDLLTRVRNEPDRAKALLARLGGSSSVDGLPSEFQAGEGEKA